jgi:glycosyltransferase involved in cell wall biosynthesis
VAENDVAGFAEQVIRLIEDREMACRLGDNARSFVSNEYSIQTAVSRVTDTYRQVLAR